MTRYVLALDQGTTSSRAIVFDHSGQPVANAQREFSQIFPQPGWVEHDANEIWTTQLGCAQEAMQRAQVAITDVVAIGIANQRETTVLWDRKTGIPIAPAMVWQDRRTTSMCAKLRERGIEQEITRKTGLLLDPYFSGTKLAWMLDNVPDARARAERGELAFGTIDTWLTWKLTGGAAHVTDVSNASRTLLFNLHTLDWDGELLQLLDIPSAVLPKVMSSSAIIGESETHFLGRRIPIASIAGDQQAATFGQACFAPGTAKNTYGTGCFMLMNAGTSPRVSTNRLLSTVGWRCGSGTATYLIEGSVFVGGAVVQWLRDGLGLFTRADEVEALAAKCTDTGGVAFVPAFAGLGAPHWDPDARGLIIGITRGTTTANIARAALESIAHQSADVLEAMQRDAGTALTELRVDGGAARNNTLMQLQADLIGVPVVRPRVTETTALGAAFLAGLAVGLWHNAEEIASLWQSDQRFDPKMDTATREAMRASWHRAVQRSRSWVAPPQ